MGSGRYDVLHVLLKEQVGFAIKAKGHQTLESCSRPLESFSRPLESFRRPLAFFSRPLESFSYIPPGIVAAPWNRTATPCTYVCMKAWCGENVNGLLWWKSNYILKTGLTLLYVCTGSICVYCLQNLNTKGPGFEALPESFGDICCEYGSFFGSCWIWLRRELKLPHHGVRTAPASKTSPQRTKVSPCSTASFV